ncbi:hypothetical protein BN2475_100111 [Paraburkholderia ribeironis]|uniref:Uncharacterized protein n=1 Tax=Paraburkholderia ribeironis TaxID=1247936 RepID=A0A1N7RPN7_9BURK|nr:hypothetical protein BN2475_100111 [Paraburkholderia ribeironis]
MSGRHRENSSDTSRSSTAPACGRVSARPCCPSCRRTADADAPPARCRAAECRSRAARLADPARPRSCRPGRRSDTSSCVRSWRRLLIDFQTLDDLAVGEMGVDDLVDVGFVDVRVPDAFRIHDERRAELAAIEATGLVDAHLAGAGEAKCLHAFFRVLLHLLRIAVCAARAIGAGLALIDAEKHVVLVEGIHDVRWETVRMGPWPCGRGGAPVVRRL